MYRHRLTTMTSDEQKLIRAAIDASSRSKPELGKTNLPPKVGAAILFPDGRIESAARGQNKPGEHAEYTLFEMLKGQDLAGCVLATTLEPCTKRGVGKIPCCDRILQSGIKKVFVGNLDPNPDIYNHGYRKLRAEKVDVQIFPTELRDEVAAINHDFIEIYARNQALDGRVSFDCERNNQFYTFGAGEYEFAMRWSHAGNGAIYCYKDEVSITIPGVCNIADIARSDHLDYTYPSVCISKDEVLVGKNRHGHFIAVKNVEAIPRQPMGMSSK